MDGVRDREDGFTLIELCMVVLIIAVLIAIAIPLFLGQRERAEDAAAKETARITLTAVRATLDGASSYTAVTPAALRESEPELEVVDAATPSEGPKEASVGPGTSDETFYSAVYSRSGVCFYVRDETAATVTGTSYAARESSAVDCRAQNVAGLTFEPSW